MANLHRSSSGHAFHEIKETAFDLKGAMSPLAYFGKIG